jgi:hypothetical protein
MIPGKTLLTIPNRLILESWRASIRRSVMVERHPVPAKLRPTTRKPATGSVVLLIGTRKGALILKSDRTRRTWKLSGPVFLGHIVHHLV